jgi:hypothetical protein
MLRPEFDRRERVGMRHDELQILSESIASVLKKQMIENFWLERTKIS